MKKVLLLSTTTIIAIVLLLYIHNIPKTLTPQDTQAIEAFFKRNNLTKEKANTFESEKTQIKTIQHILLKELNCLTAIPKDQTREPADLFQQGCGGCFDKSRTLEKIFQYIGYETRHVSIFKKEEGKGRVSALLTKGWPSHAALEVETTSGWLTVDPVFPWMAETKEGVAMDMETIQEARNTTWKEPVPEEIAHHYNGETFRVIGLYSRHGRFYPPYDFIPDYNLIELFQN